MKRFGSIPPLHNSSGPGWATCVSKDHKRHPKVPSPMQVHEIDCGELRGILNFQFGVCLNYFKMTGYFQQLYLKDNIGITWRK